MPCMCEAGMSVVGVRVDAASLHEPRTLPGLRLQAPARRRLVVHGDAQPPARLGGHGSHRVEGLREFRPDAAKALSE
ncbi:hypothetical protein GCM10010304_77370 [Streptomyces roseoviolaceus]